MYALRDELSTTLEEIRAAGLYKTERQLTTPQSVHAATPAGPVLNFCANNYLGLADNPTVLAAARYALDAWGFGMASVRFICGTQTLHTQLEKHLSEFLGMEDTILFSSCFDANGGLFETLLGPEDAIISDALNHASIIDGIRLCKAQRHRYQNDDLNQLEDLLKETQSARQRLIATDGVFSMDGNIARVKDICDLADRYGAMVHVDDSHATGFVGATGRGSHEYNGCLGRVDIITSTLGKALGGAAGGFTAARPEIVELLRNRSRPYLFSNSVPPPIVAASLAVMDLLTGTGELLARLNANTKRFREGMTAAGFAIKPGVHPIVPVMLGDARLASEFAARMSTEGIYVVGFSYPVVPQGQARIRVQLSAGHKPEHVEHAITAFTKVGRELGVIA